MKGNRQPIRTQTKYDNMDYSTAVATAREDKRKELK